ncbi:MAG: aspartyl-phosphate phosphatase Spo0E family protein [Solibacillus sp.]
MEKEILRQLEIKRQLMIASGIKNGFSNKKTIQLSEQVDRLINAFDAKRFEELTKGDSRLKIMQ